ncbi:MBL fold metallo-hydrolase [Candidatus Aerophobetes bacterium]|nr:MBL fold metallo-hydrolase [Candidatus Aerophobetes bacterium]
MALEITWLGHDSFKIESDKNFKVYIDPWKIEKKDEASLVLITHSHYDHFSPEDVKKVQGENTHILVTGDVADKLKGKVRGVGPDEDISLQDVNVKTYPAYNIDKPYHPRENAWVGYVVKLDNVSIYHSGDTDFIPEMEKIKPYVALLPIGGIYTMDVEDALRAVELLNPELVIPMHYGDIVGDTSDAKRFAKKCKVQVQVLSKGESLKVE